MNLFTISQLAQFSGIKAHTIRIWEQRYNALKPSRSEGNTRYYDNDQLRRLLNIVSLMESDYKVSELCAMPDKKLFKLLAELQNKTASGNPNEYFISQLIAAGMSYDEPYFEKIFSHCLLRYGMKNTYVNVMYPTLMRIGLMWSTDALPPAHEHYISNILRQKLFTAIDSLPPAKYETGSWLLFLPENEFHEIGLLMSHYLIRLSGRRSFYLGGNLPIESLVGAVKDLSPENMLLFLVHYDAPENANEYLGQLSNHFPRQKIFVAASQRLVKQLKARDKIFTLETIEDLDKNLPV